MIELTELSQTNLWGLQYARQVANEPIKLANDALALLEDPNKPEPQELYTDQSYAEFIFNGMCDSWFSEVRKMKMKSVVNMIESLSPEQQTALAVQFQIPDVIKS